MARPVDIIRENDENIKYIREKVDGKLVLQHHILQFIEEHEQEEKERIALQGAGGGPVPSQCELLVQERAETQGCKKKKTDEVAPLDADGVHQPVSVTTWSDDPGPLRGGSDPWHKRYTLLSDWSKKHFEELFSYLEPSLFGGALQPTDSLKVLQQLMERCFGYCTGVVHGQVATKLRYHKDRTKQQRFELFRQEYIRNGRPLRVIKFKNKAVCWEERCNGIYKSFLVEDIPAGQVAPAAADACGFCVLNTLNGMYASVPAVSCGTSSKSVFMGLKVMANHNVRAAKYKIPNAGVPLAIHNVFERAGQNCGQEAPATHWRQLPIANAPFSSGGGSPKKSKTNVGAHSPDRLTGTPNRRLGKKSPSNPKSPGSPKSPGTPAASAKKGLARQVPPPPSQQEVADKREAAKQRAAGRTATPLAKKQRLASPAGSKSLRAQANDSSSTED